MTDPDQPPAAPMLASLHLFRLAQLGERLQQTVAELTDLTHRPATAADLTGAELDAVHTAAAYARTAGSEIVAIAFAAYDRVHHAGQDA